MNARNRPGRVRIIGGQWRSRLLDVADVPGLRPSGSRVRETLPEASCVLILPCDFPILDKEAGELQPRQRLLEIMQIQRELAPEHGCGVWDGLAFMGGFGAIADWVHAEPPLARGDYLHFTRRGSVIKAMTLSDALMLEYDWARDPTLTPVPSR